MFLASDQSAFNVWKRCLTVIICRVLISPSKECAQIFSFVRILKAMVFHIPDFLFKTSRSIRLIASKFLKVHSISSQVHYVHPLGI